MAKRIQVGGRIESNEVGGIVTGAAEILDDEKGKKQSVINGETDDELLRLDQSKQDNLTFDNAPTEGSDNPVKSGGVYAADKALSDAIEAILLLIPSAASALNKLVDTAMMNSSISTATATFRGTYNVVTDLSLTVDATHEQIAAALGNAISTADNNDYAFVQVPVSEESTDIRRTERYKFNGTAWGYEYDLNTSGFTAAQWAAINSGITIALVGKLIGLPTSSELQALLGQKQNTLTFDNVPTAGSANPVKSGGVHTAINDEKMAREQLEQTVTGIDGRVENVEEVIPTGAAANNKLVANNSMEAYVTSIIEAITASFTIATADGHINLTLTQTNGRVASLTLTSSDIASAQALTALTGRVSTAESNITSLGGRVSTNETDIAELQELYNSLQQSKPVPVTELPSTGQQQGVIYRLAGTTSYSDYMWNGSMWVLMATYNNAIDPRPKKGSQNLVTSGGVFDNMGALDVSELNATENPHTLAQYVDLSAALAAVPTDYQKGGMSVKFVQSSDNKYVQYFLTKDEWSIDPNDWEKMNLEEEVSQLGQKMFAIKHMGTSASLWHDWEVGDYMYYTSSKFFIEVLGVDGSGNITTFRDFQPILGAIYTYDNQLYIWTGTDLIQKTKDVSISQIVQNGDIDGIVTIGSDSFAIRNATHDESYGLKNGYLWSDGWNNDQTRVSAKILNAKLASMRVVCKDNIKIAGYITLNDDYSFGNYTALSSQTIQDITLDAGYYYYVIFMFKNGGNITPQDVLPHIAIGKSISIQTLESQMDELYGIDLSKDFVAGRWFTGVTIGQGLAEVSADDTISVKTPVSQGDIFRLTAKGGSSGRAWYFLDATEKVVDLSPSNFNDSIILTIPTGVAYLVTQSNNGTMTLIKGGVEPQIEILNERVDTLENKVDGFEVDSFKPKTPFLWSKLSRVKNLKDIFANIGFIGDSWTQGTENIVGGVTSGFESYDKWVAKALLEEYGFGGLGWLDFARDGGSGKMFGCVDMYEHWSYAFSGNVTGLDGSTSGQASQCLGICCAHTIFGNGASLSLSFNAGYLDRFKIRYYKNAHFNVSVNGGSPVEITANATDGWQETEFGVAGTDITSVVITSLADNSIIFGMDCYYGTYGVRCHKIGNRSIQASNYLSMDATQWEQGIAKLKLCWASVLLAINDLGGSTDPTRMDTIVTNIGNLINRLKIATDDGNGLVTCDMSLLGVENIEASGYLGLGMLAAKQKEFALANGYGWASTDKCIGATKAEFVHNKTFSDTIHLNIIGSYAYGQHIYNSLFRF